MKYLKNIELAERYEVSPNTIGNWIEAAKSKKLNIQIYDEGTRSYILNSPHNHIILKELSSKGKKFKNSRSLKTIEPKPEFYKIFNETQIIDIITNLETNQEIDLKYGYFKEGALNWNNYVESSLNQNGSNTTRNSIQLLNLNFEYILSLLSSHTKINIIDIGVGNGAPVKNFIDKLIKRRRLNKYIGIDYSPDIIKVASDNLTKWFGSNLIKEFFVRDITYQELRDILFLNTQVIKEDTINIILFMGSTIENQRTGLYNQALRLLHSSMGPNDILIIGQTLDTENARINLSHNHTTFAENKSREILYFIPDLLNISPEYYEVKRFFNKTTKATVAKMYFKIDVQIKIKTGNIDTLLKLNNREKILIWRHTQHTYNDIVQDFSKVGFNLLQTSTSSDYSNILVITKLKTI